MLLDYDPAKLAELLQNFYTLTGMRIVVFSNEFEKIAEHPSRDSLFCSLIRGDSAAEARCVLSDRGACERCRETQRIHSYTCHAGLTEIVAPIRCGNAVIGYLMFGQVLQTADMEAHWLAIWERCRDYRVDEEALRRAFFEKVPIGAPQIYAAAQILEACAGYLYLSRSITLEEDSLPRQIDAYIGDHLAEDLSAANLCRRFAISRSKLYRVANRYFGVGIEQLIRKTRIQKAQELLSGTALPLSEISDLVGFGDYNYFIKVFKRYTGATPLRYRKGEGG